ncbi:hypothetical protein BGZ60DRAFT_397709 [Tricladium varicosporioides]|nr:hypothetical protein BGZ60DRAFT_397709 [Hymenoscyphus varicosporioides]
MLCLSSRTWPFPKPIGAERPKFSIFMPSRILPITNFKLPRGCMHKSALVIPHIINSPEYYSFKVGTITWINGRLSEISVGTNDATIGSILLLINFELMRGNVAETLHHMDGIEQVVKLRGGLSSINDRNVLTRILIIDLLVAFLSTSQPRFSPPSLLPADVLGSTFYKLADSPLTSMRTLKVALSNSPFCEASITCLQRAQSLTIHVMSGNRSYPSAQEPETTTEHGRLNLLEIIQHTSQIYERALLTPPMPFSSRINRNSVVALCQAVESPLNDYTWDECPGILTWVLLVGCAASEEESVEYNYFMCLLIKIFLGAGYGWLDELREAVITIVAIKARAEKGTRIVAELKDSQSNI